jgi:5'-nucleotidase (lipoprotein e(P4) family)
MNFAKGPMNPRRVCLAVMLASLLTLTARAQNLTAQAVQPAQADNEYQTGAVLWQQSSAEARALQYQAYALARLMLDRDLRVNARLKRQRAVVVDVDETVLDNSASQAALVINRQAFTSAA